MVALMLLIRLIWIIHVIFGIELPAKDVCVIPIAYQPSVTSVRFFNLFIKALQHNWWRSVGHHTCNPFLGSVYHNYTIIIFGDVELPNIDWTAVSHLHTLYTCCKSFLWHQYQPPYETIQCWLYTHPDLFLYQIVIQVPIIMLHISFSVTTVYPSSSNNAWCRNNCKGIDVNQLAMNFPAYT